jgi:hypothetical protein
MVILYTRSGQPLPANFKDEKGKPICLRDRKCVRCGGAGGSEAWRVTGWTCYRCDGKGTDPVQERERLYTPEQNAKLDAAAEKRAATKAAAKAEADRIEQERRDRERAEIISANEGFVARIDAELAHGDVEILQSVRDRITLEAKEPTERQVEVVNQIIDRNEKERARLAGARHVGEIKKRQTFTLTLLYTQSRVISDFPLMMSHWSLFTDENGCKIASKSAPRLFGFSRHEKTRQYIKGSTSRVKATVVEHTTDKNGEPITYINRPKVES